MQRAAVRMPSACVRFGPTVVVDCGTACCASEAPASPTKCVGGPFEATVSASTGPRVDRTEAAPHLAQQVPGSCGHRPTVPALSFALQRGR